MALTFARSRPTSGPRGRAEDDSREHGEGDQRDGQAEHGQRATDVADGRERHLVSAGELCGKQSGGGQPSSLGLKRGLAEPSLCRPSLIGGGGGAGAGGFRLEGVPG